MPIVTDREEGHVLPHATNRLRRRGPDVYREIILDAKIYGRLKLLALKIAGVVWPNSEAPQPRNSFRTGKYSD